MFLFFFKDFGLVEGAEVFGDSEECKDFGSWTGVRLPELLFCSPAIDQVYHKPSFGIAREAICSPGLANLPSVDVTQEGVQILLSRQQGRVYPR